MTFKPGTLYLKKLTARFSGIEFPPPQSDADRELESYLFSVAMKEARGEPLSVSDMAAIKLMQAWSGEYDDED